MSGEHTAYQYIRHLRRCAAFFTAPLQYHCQQSQRPTDASRRYTCFRQWRSTAGGKENIGRQIQTAVQWNTSSSMSETVQNRKHAHTFFLLRMIDTVTSQNIDLSSWDTLYTVYIGNISESTSAYSSFSLIVPFSGGHICLLRLLNLIRKLIRILCRRLRIPCDFTT
jgi:hypothetical protein